MPVDIEDIGGSGIDTINGTTSEIEGDDEEQEKKISEVETEEETSRKRSMFLKQPVCYIFEQIDVVKKIFS